MPSSSLDPCVPARLQSQLVGLGVPASQHSREGLLSYFPPEFNIGVTKLGTADLARVLVHFAKNNIITLERSGVPSAFNLVQPGWHFCQFYRDFDQLLEMIAPYIAEGLKNG